MTHFRIVFRAILLIVCIVLVIGLINDSKHLMPSSPIIIESGPVGGSYHRNALLYAKRLQAMGFQVEIRPNPQTLESIEHVNNQQEGVRADIAFTAQAIDAANYPDVRSLGVIEIQPLFTFIRKNIADKVKSPSDLKGLKIVLPPERSATTATALAVLKLYGVTDANSTFAYLPFTLAITELLEGNHDAGMFMLTIDNPILAQVEAQSVLAQLSFIAAPAVAGKLPWLKHVELPVGAFDIQHARPPHPVNLVGAAVNVVVNKDIHPAVLYELLKTMSEVHRESLLLAPPGGFPSMANTALPLHPLAVQYEKTGIPWIYRNFPHILASAIDRYLLIALIFIVIVETYKFFHYSKELRDWLTVFFSTRYFSWINRRLAHGKQPGQLALLLLIRAEDAANRNSKEAGLQTLMKTVQSQLKKSD